APLVPAVVTVGTIAGGVKENIIPSEASFTLNVRSVDEATRESFLAGTRRFLEAEAAASRAPAPVVEELYRFPRCYNTPRETAEVVAALEAEFGVENVEGDAAVRMGSEDVGRLADAIDVPMVFWYFGGHRPSDF